MTIPNWFEHGKQNFNTFLKPLAGQDNLKFLQLGAFSGDGSIWMLDNILTGDNSVLYDIDNWGSMQEDNFQGALGREEKVFDWEGLEKYYDERTAKYDNLVKVKTMTQTFLETTEELFDFVYVDADHTPEGAYQDGALSWKVLNVGGIIAFDDYLWFHPETKEETKPGIDKFLEEHLGRYEILHKHWQVWLKKTQD